MITAAAVAIAQAQYRPIPNYIGIGAGQEFRNDINNHLSGVTPIAPRIVSIPFAQLPAEQDGQEYWVPNATQANPCTAGGSGALAVGIRGQWNCLSGASGTALGGFPLTANVSAASHSIQNLAVNTATGDALSQGQSHLNELAPAQNVYSMGNNRLQWVRGGAQALDALSYGQSGAQLNGLDLNNNQLANLSAASASGQALAYAQNGAQLTTNQAAGALVSSSQNNANATSVAINAPAGIVAGNALVANIFWVSPTGTFTPPAGWTQIRADATSVSYGLTAGVFCKVATGSEPANYTFGFSVAQNVVGSISQISGITCATDGSSVSAGGANSITAPAFATTHSSDYVVAQGSSYNPASFTASIGGRLISDGNANGDLLVTGRINPGVNVPAVVYSGTLANVSLASQVAFVTATTIQSLPVLSGQIGASIQSLTASNSQVLNVQAAPYNAQADGNTDDGPAIQQAIYDAERAVPPTFPNPNLYPGGFGAVYLPRSATGKCYDIGKPIRVASGAIEIKGDDGTCIQKLYAGPTIINEGWGIDFLQYGPALVGTGQSLSTVGYLSSNTKNGFIDLAQLLDTTQINLATRFASGFDIEFWMEQTTTLGGNVFRSNPNNPGGGNGMVSITASGGAGNPVAASVNTTGGLVSLAACPSQTQNTAYDMALDWDGTTYRLFQGGVLCSSVASANAPVLGPFESMQLPALGGFDYWMAGGNISSPFQGYLDSMRFESVSEHVANYTPPTARFAADGNTVLLLNWDASLDGTQLGYTQNAAPVYLPVLGGGQNTIGTSMHLHNLELCADDGQMAHRGDGLFSQWAVGSEIDHVSCSNAVYAGLNFYNNDFGTIEHNNTVLSGMLGILHGVAWNGARAYDDAMDSQSIACEETVGDGGGGFHDSHQLCTNRGTLRYCKMYMGEAFTGQVDFENCDQEAGDSNFVASDLLQNPLISLQFNSPDFVGVSGHPFIEQDGGGMGPTLVAPQFQGGGTAIINYGQTPSAPAVLINPTLPAGVPLSNNLSFVEVIGSNSILSALQLQSVPTFSAGLNHIAVNAIANPAPASIAVVGATGSTGYGPYFVVCHDINGGATLPSNSSNTVANGPATLSGSDYIRVTWTGLTGCASWDVLKGSLTTSIATALPAGTTSYNDIGGSTSAYTPPVRNTTGDISYGSVLTSAGMTYANLPSPTVNGGRFYCSDCDPPANPPAACTHTGTKTGAFADGVNGVWLCAP
ncbi:MAG: hypothetical protein IVW56_02570 [Candidatus Binataceae bacterium]|nr:hypothetical protein [Candidatus Binataceae bacterium]